MERSWISCLSIIGDVMTFTLTTVLPSGTIVNEEMKTSFTAFQNAKNNG